MPQGTITDLHIARVKGTPSDPVQEATAISGLGLDGAGLAPGQVKENITVTGLNVAEVKPGQVFTIGDDITLEAIGDCEACSKMDAIRLGLKDQLQGKRGMLAKVLNGGSIKVGDSVTVQ